MNGYGAVAKDWIWVSKLKRSPSQTEVLQMNRKASLGLDLQSALSLTDDGCSLEELLNLTPIPED